MENPAWWTEVEYVIDAALDSWDRSHEAGVVGGSRAMTVANALRVAGFLKEVEAPRIPAGDPICDCDHSLGWHYQVKRDILCGRAGCWCREFREREGDDG